MSSSGKYQVLISTSTIFISSNYGSSWSLYGATAVPNNAPPVNTIQFASINGVTSQTITKQLFSGVSISSSGQYITICSSNTSTSIKSGYLFTSNDYGDTWTTVNNSIISRILNWIDVQVSATGQYQIAAVNKGQIYVSYDYGNSWNYTILPNQLWVSISMSSNGEYISAVTSTGTSYQGTQTNGLMFQSNNTLVSDAYGPGFGVSNTSYNNFGQSWVLNTNTFAHSILSIGTSSSGQYVLLATQQQIFASNNNGQTFTSIYSFPNTMTSCDIDISTSGQYVVVLAYSASTSLVLQASNISQTSNTYNLVAITTSSPKIIIDNLSSVSVSGNGQYQVITAKASNSIFISTNYGSNWNQVTIFGTSTAPSTVTSGSCAMSTSGQYIVVYFGNYGLFVSSNYGQIWNQITSNLPTPTTTSVYNVDISTSGQYITLTFNNTLYSSSSYGTNWSINTSSVLNTSNIFTDLSMSSTGQYQVLATTATGGNVYVSSDYGNTWLIPATPPPSSWQGITISSSGLWIYVISSSTLYTSFQGTNVSLGTNKGDYLVYSGNIYNNWVVVGENSILLGANAGYTGQGLNSVAIGNSSGYSNQGQNSIAIGNMAGWTGQGVNSIAIGFESGNQIQGTGAVGIGYESGNIRQGQYSIAIGNNAGNQNQGQYSIAIGNNAGQINQGQYSIAIGNNAGTTGSSYQAANSIILNATSNGITAGNTGFFVSPVTTYTSVPSTASNLYYNRTTYEIFAGPSPSSSDYRVKDNIMKLDDTINVDSLNPLKYYNTVFNREEIGLIAHELQEIYPFLVTGEKDGHELQTINYNSLIGILVKELQDLKPRLEKLEKRFNL